MPSIVALIPARAGSKRVPGKNIKRLGGKPLIAWTIEAAETSGIFDQIIVSTNNRDAAEIAMEYRASWSWRDPAHATDDAPDICWVTQLVEHFPIRADAFAILRPTSPFRTADTIRRAWWQFQGSESDSIRAVQPVKEHPGKMWQCEGVYMHPLIDATWPPVAPGYQPMVTPDSRPWHSQPTQTLPTVYVQNASLEIAWTYVVKAFGTISGRRVRPFFTEGIEGFDINTPEDWARAEQIMADQHQPLHYLG